MLERVGSFVDEQDAYLVSYEGLPAIIPKFVRSRRKLPKDFQAVPMYQFIDEELLAAVPKTSA